MCVVFWKEACCGGYAVLWFLGNVVDRCTGEVGTFDHRYVGRVNCVATGELLDMTWRESRGS